MKKNITITLIIVTLTVCNFINLYSQVSNFDYKILLNKYEYVEGEDVILKYILINKGSSIDSVQNFSENRLDNDLIVENEKGDKSETKIYLFTDDFWVKLNPGETKEIVTVISELKSFKGCIFFHYFPEGVYKVKSTVKDSRGQYLNSNVVDFSVKKPEGEQLIEFNKFLEFINEYNKFNRTTPHDEIIRIHKILTDKSIQFLYLFPKSIYTLRLLWFHNNTRLWNKYKCDDSFIEDNEFYIRNNIELKNYSDLLPGIKEFFDTKYNNKEAGKEYLKSLKIKYNNENLNDVVDDYLKTVK